MFRLRKKYRYVRKFKIIKLSEAETNSGRCINCDANEICGRKISCLCKFDEHFIEIDIK